jgi:hypothetical protein
MADMSVTQANAVLNTMRATNFTSWTPHISLHTSDPGITGASEASGSGYGRRTVTFGVPATVTGAQQSANTTLVEWTTLDATNPRTITHAGVWDASNGGNFRYRIVLDASKVVNAGDPCSFAIGDLKIRIA